jgi:hypothetical protein
VNCVGRSNSDASLVLLVTGIEKAEILHRLM